MPAYESVSTWIWNSTPSRYFYDLSIFKFSNALQPPQEEIQLLIEREFLPTVYQLK